MGDVFMPRGKNTPCHPKLDAMLESYFCIEGASIKSISDITARGTTSPVALNRSDVMTETGKLMSGLTGDELRELALYYEWRSLAELATNKATEARQEARKRGKRRRFRTAITEVQRKWNEKRKAPR